MKKKWIVLIIIVIVLIGVRIALPFIVERQLNDRLSNLNGYEGSVKDVDLHLYRGAYEFHQFKVMKTGDSIPEPFIDIPRTDISIQWDALFKGKIVSRIIFTGPDVNFVIASTDTGKVKQDGSGVKWHEHLQEMIPIKLNKVQVVDGKLGYKDYTSNPRIDITIDSLQLTAKNLNNVQKDNEGFPSSMEASGIALGTGVFNLSAEMNVLQDVPDIDANFQIERVNLTSLNNLLRAYTNTDAEDGKFFLYTEVLLKDKEISGYVKPVLENVDLVKWKKEDEPLRDKIWESIVGGVAELFENQPKERIATRVPLQGTVENVDAGVLPTLWNVIRNAFVEAFQKELENTVGNE